MGLKYRVLEILFIIHSSCIVYHLAQVPVYSIDLETALRKELFDSYSTVQRPEKKVLVVADLTLLTINEMNIKDQTLSVSAQLGLSWLDFRLNWTTGKSQDYSSIIYMFATEKWIWKPTVYVENSVVDLSVISDLETPMRIDQKGFVQWSTSAIYIVSCESDITYYPMDYQVCEIKLSTAGYTSLEINLSFFQDPVALDYFTENGEWELLSVSTIKPDDKFKMGASYSKLVFRIHLRRRPVFHILNTMFPVVLMAFLIPMAFKLHAESGEKIGYCLTVLLAYAVYLTMISDNIPSTSLSICYLSIYLASTLILSTLSVLFVILVINVYHTPEEEPMSDRLKSFALKLELCFCKKKHSNSTKQQIKVAPAPNETSDKNAVILDSCEAQEEEMTWIRLSRLLDKFFFMVFMIIITLSTFVFSFLISYKLIST